MKMKNCMKLYNNRDIIDFFFYVLYSLFVCSFVYWADQNHPMFFPFSFIIRQTNWIEGEDDNTRAIIFSSENTFIFRQTHILEMTMTRRRMRVSHCNHHDFFIGKQLLHSEEFFQELHPDDDLLHSRATASARWYNTFTNSLTMHILISITSHFVFRVTKWNSSNWNSAKMCGFFLHFLFSFIFHFLVFHFICLGASNLYTYWA